MDTSDGRARGRPVARGGGHTKLQMRWTSSKGSARRAAVAVVSVAASAPTTIVFSAAASGVSQSFIAPEM